VKSIVFVLIFILWAINCPAKPNKTCFMTSGTSRARALAMGSAFFSIEDDFSAGLYNPGAFKINATRSERPFRIFVNPIVAGVGLYDFSQYDNDFEKDEKLTAKEALLSAATAIKGAVYTTPIFDLGINLWEEIIESDSTSTCNGRFLSTEQLTRNSFHTAFLNFKIAPSVSIGISGSVYSGRRGGETTYKSGHTFGVMLNPNPKMKVGIAYNSFPNGFSNARFGLESLENEAVTSGISYYPDKKTVLSIDLRNLNKDDTLTAREIHTGIEREFGGMVSLRAGYYRKKSTKNDVISLGIGVLPRWEKLSKFATSSRNDILSYTVILEENGLKKRWHVFSLLLRY